MRICSSIITPDRPVIACNFVGISLFPRTLPLVLNLQNEE